MNKTQKRNSKMQYVDFGYSADELITTDGELLATLGFTPEELGNDRIAGNEDIMGMFNKFVEAGGSDTHSGYSWSCVRSVAAVLVKNGWSKVADIPEGNPLRERVKVS
jgi:hypothetical protein